MSEDVFRIIVTVAVILACIAFIVQAVVALAIYGVARKLQAKISPLVEKLEAVAAKATPAIEKLGPVVEKTGPAVEKATAILTTTHQILEENRPRIAAISKEALVITESGRQQVERLGNLLNDAGERARARLAQIDETVDSTVNQVEHVGESMKRAVMKPVREVNGVAAAISAVVGTLVHGSRRSSVDHATQDEEMFI
ncbi:MAG TPA: hypothetical protein VJ732_19765 [Bryobacteraceae bacterium]|nr:hypothetical protein [Bryobacteraceae bacterium]